MPGTATCVAPATLRDLVATFDEHVFPDAAARFGPAVDVDRDGRFTVLFSSGLARLADGKVSVNGFVRGADLDLRLGAPFGNRCDMMYLSTGLEAGPHLRTVVAHEYTHAVSFSRKVLGNPAGPEEDGWLDEALAHLVEDAQGFSRSNLDYRVSAFLSRPERYRLVVDDYYASDLFRSHGNRGATYLFLRWCVDRYGPGLVEALDSIGAPGGCEPGGGDRIDLRRPLPTLDRRPLPQRARPGRHARRGLSIDRPSGGTGGLDPRRAAFDLGCSRGTRGSRGRRKGPRRITP